MDAPVPVAHVFVRFPAESTVAARVAGSYNEAMFLLFHGPDEFSAHEALAQIRATHDFGFSEDRFAGADGNLEAIRVACDTLPFLSERRLVVVEGLPKKRRTGKDEVGAAAGSSAIDGERESDGGPVEEPRSSAKGRKGKASAGADSRAFITGLAEYAAHVPPTTVLVVITEDRLEDASPLVKAAKAHGEVRSFVPPSGDRLVRWIQQRAGAEDLHVAPAAARLLMEEVGDNLRVLVSELEKLRTYAGPGGQVGVAEVRALTPASKQSRVFDLTDALARQDRSRAFALVHELLSAGESPLGIIALTAYQTRTLMLVKSGAERGLRAFEIAQEAGLAPFVVEKSLPLARRFSFAQLEGAHRLLLEIDAALKRSRMTPDMALDLLVVEFGGAR